MRSRSLASQLALEIIPNIRCEIAFEIFPS